MTSYLQTFVDSVGRELDITPTEFEVATQRYADLAAWIQHEYPGTADIHIYPQGSFRLGTVVRPVIDRGDFDIDLVFRRDIQPNSITQERLRDEAGELLAAYCEAKGFDEPVELGRCWRLDFFDDGFHLDVLPAIPHEDAETAIRLTDKDLREWQYSNPIGYAEWFRARQNQRLVAEERSRLAGQFGVQIDDVPEFLVRTPLQRVVQVLKRSRDVYFNDDKQAPPSILITTLAAHAYGGQANLDDALVAVVSDLDQHLELRGEDWWLPNPAHERENFAEKWKSDPDRREKFYEWLDALQGAVTSTRVAESIDLAMERLDPVFGDSTAIAKAAAIGASVGSTRDQARGLAPAPSEEFPEFKFRDVRWDHTVEVELAIENEGLGYTKRTKFGKRRVPKQRRVRFTMTSTSVPAPYEIYWKVRNHGEQAARRGELRGQIVSGERVKYEPTAFRGDHYVDCYIVKDGVARAKKRVWVPIA